MEVVKLNQIDKILICILSILNAVIDKLKVNGQGEKFHVHEQNELIFNVTGIFMVPIVMDGDAKDTGLVTTEVTDGST